MWPGQAQEHKRAAAERRAASSALYQELDAPSVGPDENVIPGGSREAYDAIRRKVREEGQLVDARPVLMSELANANPGKKQVDRTPRGKKPKVTRYSIEEAQRLGYAEGLDKADPKFKKFHHTDPDDEIAVYAIDDGKKKVTVRNVHVPLGLVPESVYITPGPDEQDGFTSNKNGPLWVHEHEEGSEPLEVMDPETGLPTKILRGTVISDWWRH
jgi:hypothetical protein